MLVWPNDTRYVIFARALLPPPGVTSRLSRTCWLISSLLARGWYWTFCLLLFSEFVLASHGLSKSWPEVPAETGDSPFQRQARSEVWKHFTRNVAEKKVKCLLCGDELSYNGCSTTNLKRHLETRHSSSLPTATVKVEQKRIDCFTKSKPAVKPVSATRV